MTLTDQSTDEKGEHQKGTNFGVFWVSANFRSQRASFDICSAYKFHFKMPRNSEDVNLGDRYAILLDESLKENQALREGTRRAEQRQDRTDI